jgi:hypothetical protein
MHEVRDRMCVKSRIRNSLLTFLFFFVYRCLAIVFVYL